MHSAVACCARALTLVATSMALFACSSSVELTPDSAKRALDEYYKVNGDLCVYLGKLPISVSERELKPAVLSIMTDDPPAKLLALEQLGIVSREKGGKDFTNSPTVRFDVTEKGRSSVRNVDRQVLTLRGPQTVNRDEFCFAKLRVANVLKVEEKEGADKQPQRGLVTYKVEVSDFAVWADDAAVMKSFPEIRAARKLPEKEMAKGVMFTNGKWEVGTSF
ncbi:hypothetical protein [Herbaspirillum huttiense]|uniref:hypothetical protein n=1 Tax=Herbaspirillum huttiense TaxID=863372 RepID=UPI0039AEE5D8